MMHRLGVTSLLITAACLSFGVSRDEVSRVPSGDGHLEAVLVETNAGATTSFGYFVYVVPRGTNPANGAEVAMLDGAIRNDQAYGANLRWETGSRLVVEYREARQADLRRPTAIIGADTVTVVLLSGVTDPTAPAGGMLYNLERTR